jgi:hypothetical protein
LSEAASGCQEQSCGFFHWDLVGDPLVFLASYGVTFGHFPSLFKIWSQFCIRKTLPVIPNFPLTGRPIEDL